MPPDATLPDPTTRTIEFGDFQTPWPLARAVTQHLRQTLAIPPATVVEPSCGHGTLLFSAAEAFPGARRLIGLDINPDHLATLAGRRHTVPDSTRLDIHHGDAFTADWPALLADTPDPLLILGNPPWVTNARIGALGGANLPLKSNRARLNGLDALTGKSNFDVSEWMLLQHLGWLKARPGALAMLCKTAVARKVLRALWSETRPFSAARMISIDAQRHFGASVDACLLVVETPAPGVLPHPTVPEFCRIYGGFEVREAERTIRFRDGILLSSDETDGVDEDVLGTDPAYIWRSGLKHDCSRVMELRPASPPSAGLVNGFGDAVDIEDEHVFPLLKGSDIAHGRTGASRRFVIVTQRRVGEGTTTLETRAPRTWAYLLTHGAALDRRASSIYRRQPRFSIFGIGDYAFAPWKVAISGFHKTLTFQAVGPIGGKPAMADDTVYFLACTSEQEAVFLTALLNSEDARSVFSSMIFWADKRPITREVLSRLHIGKLAARLGHGDRYADFAALRLRAADTKKAGRRRVSGTAP